MPKRGKGFKSWRSTSSVDDFNDYYGNDEGFGPYRTPRPDFFYEDFEAHMGIPGRPEHDDRAGGSDNQRRVSFKGGNRITKHGRQNDAAPIRVRLLEDDIDMVGGALLGAGSSRGRFAPYTGSRGSRMKRGRGGGRIVSSAPHSSHHRQKVVDQTGWFRIFIPFGGKSEKNYLFGVIKSHIAPLDFVPISYRLEGNDAVFFVDDLKVAEALQDADRKIVVTGGFKLVLRVVPGMPRVDLTESLKERIKLAMVKRYNTVTKALDLSRFHLDPDLVSDSFCALSRPPVLNHCMEVVAEHIPELQALNLDHNNIYVSEHLNALTRKAPELKILYLGNNRIRDLPNLLSVLKPLPLVELKLEGNPLCKKETKTEIISAVRRVLTKLTKLDGVDLPPVISFDVEEDARSRLPPWQGSFLCSEEGRVIVRQFVEQYFCLYDAGEGMTRQPLLEAYHELAVFSLTSTYPPGQNQPSGPKLNTYISDSRNLLRITDMERRNKMMRVGKLGIVSFLSELPKTQHDPASFALDLTVFSQHLISLSLTGLFREPGVKGTPLRHFLRKFVLVPVGAGFCIINEMLFVTNASPTQAKIAFSAPPAPLPVPTQLPDQASQQQAIEALAVQTTMNLIWARKCLEETSWDLQRALQAFAELNATGRVPPEAFLK